MRWKEFAAVLLNVRTRDIEDNFHYFIRPRINPTLSPYCRNLTGITQALVDEQDTFPIVYQKWVNWLTKLKAEKNLRYTDSRMRQSVSDGANTTFCSWSDFDMGFFFRIECERNGIDCPPQFKAWVDASIIFEVCCLMKFIQISFVIGLLTFSFVFMCLFVANIWVERWRQLFLVIFTGSSKNWHLSSW